MSGASRTEAHRLSEEAITVNEEPTAARKKRLPPRLRRLALAAHVIVSVRSVYTKIRIADKTG
jgi:hypothetical protein